MAITISDANAENRGVYGQLVAELVTGNELVEGGHAFVQGGIQDKFTIPTIDAPADYMIYMEFNPRTFESFYRPYQPEGELLFRELNPEVQASMLSEILKDVSNYHGQALLQGDTGGAAPYDKFDGLITKAVAAAGTNDVATPVTLTAGNVLDKFEESRALAVSSCYAAYNRPDFKWFVSTATYDLFLQALVAKTYKGMKVTETLPNRFMGKEVVVLSGMPDDTIFGAVANSSTMSNLWIGVDDIGQAYSIQVEKLQANSELHFVKMLMKTDTQIVKPQETVLYKA